MPASAPADRCGVGYERVDFDGGVAVGTDAVTIALHRGTPAPATLGHMSFHLASTEALRAALADLREPGVTLEDPGAEIGPGAAGSPNVALWFHDLDGYRWELNVPDGAREARDSHPDRT